MTKEKATSRDRKKATAKKTGRKVVAKAAADRTEQKAAAAQGRAQGTRSGLINVPNAGTGKALRRLLRKAGIYLSKDPAIGLVECVVHDGTATVTVNGTPYSTAVRS